MTQTSSFVTDKNKNVKKGISHVSETKGKSVENVSQREKENQ
jgi:hypothetical protein